MKKINFSLILAIILLSVFCTAVQAQEEETNADVAVLWSISAVDGKDAELEAAIKGFHEFMADKDGHWNWE